jgi:glycosyltransferase involved in cell wall biosynthesis
VVYNTPVDIYDSLNSRFISKEDRTIFTIFYGGILSADRGLFQLVDIVQDIPNIRLVVAGFGSIEQEFIHYLEGKVNVSFLGRVPYDKILELTFASDCVAALYDPWIPNNRLASPNKLFEAMMCGKPIIASDQSSLSELVRRENCGLVICYHEIGELREAIYRLKDDRELRIELGKNARSAYLRNYNWFTIEQGILDLIKILVNKSNNFSR